MAKTPVKTNSQKVAEQTSNGKSVATDDQEGNIFFKKAASRTFALIPNGEYTVTIENVEKKDGPKGPYLALTMVVVSDIEEINGQKLWENVSYAAEFKITQLWEAINGSVEDQPEGTEMSLNMYDLFGALIEVKVGTEKAQDKVTDRNVVKAFLPKPAPEPEPVRTAPARRAGKK